MRVFKISAYNMESWQYAYNFTDHKFEAREIVPGMRVCSCAKLAYIGVITHVAEKEKQYPGSDRELSMSVTVLWLTGPHKGKSQLRTTRQVANFEEYRNAIRRHYDEMTAYVDEANKTGM